MFLCSHHHGSRETRGPTRPQEEGRDAAGPPVEVKINTEEKNKNDKLLVWVRGKGMEEKNIAYQFSIVFLLQFNCQRCVSLRCTAC